MAEAPGAEFGLFCRILRLKAGEAEALKDAQWMRFLEGARRHRVEPLLLSGLKAAGLQTPDWVLKALRQDVQAAARASLMQMRELAGLARFFESQGFPMMALKGVALAAQLGRDPTLRNSRDLDLLIASDRLSEADRLMREKGYQTAGPPILPRQEARYRSWGKETKYVHPQSGVLVELHYRLSDNPALLDCDFEALWGARETVEIAGVPVAVMPRRPLALYLCVHGAAHGWERLCWLIDLAGALEGEGAVEAAVADAGAQDLAAPMLQALILAHDWLGLAVKDDHLARAKASARVNRLMRILRRSYGSATWYQSPARGSFKGFLHYSFRLRRHVYSLKPGFAYWKNQIARELMAPADWEAFSLPERWSWAYPFIRPVGWLLRRLRGDV